MLKWASSLPACLIFQVVKFIYLNVITKKKKVNLYPYLDFYSEETVNNQGLECLRFLNEVISDFDAVSFFTHELFSVLK